MLSRECVRIICCFDISMAFVFSGFNDKLELSDHDCRLVRAEFITIACDEIEDTGQLL